MSDVVMLQILLSGRKRRGRISTLDEFLLNRVAKMQQRVNHHSMAHQTECHGTNALW